MATVNYDSKSTNSAAIPLVTRLHGWVSSVDHKQIGIMYLGMSFIFMVFSRLLAFLGCPVDRQ